jgi:hypothetical protein
MTEQWIRDVATRYGLTVHKRITTGNARDNKLLGWILSDGVRYWTTEKRWRKHGRSPPKVYATQAEAETAIGRLKAKRWDVRGVTAQPIRCP